MLVLNESMIGENVELLVVFNIFDVGVVFWWMWRNKVKLGMYDNSDLFFELDNLIDFVEEKVVGIFWGKVIKDKVFVIFLEIVIKRVIRVCKIK